MAGHATRRSPEVIGAACEAGVEALLAAGTTHVGDISASGLSVVPLVRSGLKGIVWIEVLGITMEQGLARLEFVKRYVDELRDVAGNSPIHIGLTLHSPYSVHPDLWKPALRWIEAEALPLCVHAAESPGEWEVFTRGTGSFRVFESNLFISRLPSALRAPASYLVEKGSPLLRPFLLRQLRKLGLPYLPSPKMTPVAYLEQKGVLDFKPWLVHMVQVSDEDIERVRRSGATVVHCPRSNQRLQCGRMPLEKYLAAEIPLLIGTDSRASSPSLDVREEVALARTWHGNRVDGDLIERMAQNVAIFEAHYT
ncbi:MAG: amidohydrolase family protein [Ardenticatenaceae bacterium]